MGLKNFFKKKESLISIDIGSTSVKLVELDLSGDRPKLVNIGIAPTGADVFTNNVLTKSERVSEKLLKLLEEKEIVDRRVITAVPSPSVFTKKIKMSKVDDSELASSVQLEAGNVIPHNIDAVKLDYFVLGESGKNQLDLLIVAVKNEIIDSFVDCLALSGLDTAVVDVDYFALQNIFEQAYPEHLDKTVALINIGARYSAVNIVRGGASLFAGDIAVGGKLLTDQIAEGLGITVEEAENLKRGGKASDRGNLDTTIQEAVADLIERAGATAAAEINRQLSFFWNASGSEGDINKIMVTGGGSGLPGLISQIAEKTGIPCEQLNPFNNVEVGAGIEEKLLKEMMPLTSICMGLGLRQPGDKSAN